MNRFKVNSKAGTIGSCLIAISLMSPFVAASYAQTLPGTLKYSWLGNTFQGDGPNGTGEWTPMYMYKIKVDKAGNVLAGGHSEQGNELTVWKPNGRIENTSFPKVADSDPGRGCWGWGTINSSCAFDSSYIYATTYCNEMIRFQRQPPYNFVNSWPIADSLIYGFALDKNNSYLGTSYGKIMVRKKSDFSVVKDTSVGGAVVDMTIDKNNFLWIIVGTSIRKYDLNIKYQNVQITDVIDPTAISIDNTGKLVVCENGPRKQVLFYDISSTPTLSKTFGADSGLYGGIAGEMQPQKLFNLTGAGTDSVGNLYVSMSKQEAVLGKFAADGTFAWQIFCTFYIDNVSVDPSSDGKAVYGVDELFTMDYTKSAGQEPSFKALTYNPVKYPTDARNYDGMKTYPCFGWIRTLSGKKYQFMQGQYSADIDIYYFADTYISHKVATVKSGAWANFVDTAGNIWTTGANNTIVMHRFTGLDANGVPQYALNDKSYATPPQFNTSSDVIQRIRFYTQEQTGVAGGVMYLSGYTTAKPEVDWGVVGSLTCRFDGWQTGNTSTATMQIDVPVDGEGHFSKEMDVAGDYVFYVTTRPANNHDQPVFVYDGKTGAFVGNMYPQVSSGWTDMENAISTFKRSNGEYVVFVEEDGRGKVNIYRWCPTGNCPEVSTAAFVPLHKHPASVPSLRISGNKIELYSLGNYRGMITVTNLGGKIVTRTWATGTGSADLTRDIKTNSVMMITIDGHSTTRVAIVNH